MTSNRYKCEIRDDINPFDPREFGCLSVLSLSIEGYDLPNEMPVPFDDLNSWEEVHDYIKSEGGLFIKPVYAYIHGGITISLGSFSCRWDSGCVGFVFTTQKNIDGWGISEDMVEQTIASEIKEYDQYLTGDSYLVDIIDTIDGEIIDTFGGFGYSKIIEEAECRVAELNEKEPEQLLVTT
jgi:hypothetical protein